jgi:hypothetical protein
MAIEITGWYGPDDCPACRRWDEIAAAVAERAARDETGQDHPAAMVGQLTQRRDRPPALPRTRA